MHIDFVPSPALEWVCQLKDGDEVIYFKQCGKHYMSTVTHEQWVSSFIQFANRRLDVIAEAEEQAKPGPADGEPNWIAQLRQYVADHVEVGERLSLK